MKNTSLKWLQQKLEEKNHQLNELQKEIDETNQGTLQLIMELENTADEKLLQSKEVIEQLQKELVVTDQGLLALAVELEQARDRYQNILSHAREAIITLDERARIETFNPAALELFSFSEKELKTLCLSDLISGFEKIFVAARDSNMYPALYGVNGDVLGRRKNKRNFPLEFSLSAPFFTDKKSWIVIIRDISKRVKMEEGLRLMAKIFENSHDAIMITDTDACIVNVNAAFTEITGYSREEVIGKSSKFMNSGFHDKAFYENMWRQLLKTGQWCGEIWDKKKNGDIFPKWLSISAVADERDQITHYVGIFTDISQRKEAENKLISLAHYDQLTGLPNRTLFYEKMQWSVDLANRGHYLVALLFLDLDRFKIINDTLGHQAGDQLLIEVAGRLKKAVRATDIVCRLAGDEFTVVLTQIHGTGEIDRVARKILDSFQAPFTLQDRELFVTASIGAAVYPQDSEDIHGLLKNADTAMYYAKNMGKNTYAVFTESMNRQAHDELELETDLRHALISDEFLLYYQPQIDLTSGQIVGIEALIRWRHPKLGFISPDRFIPYAEQTDLIVLIGDWVLREACRQYMVWMRRGLPPVKLSVNYSGVQLRQSNQLSRLSSILVDSGMNPGNLCLELTESVAMENAENNIKTLHEFKKMGISISIDDFGTGYSSLSYLKRFPIDTLKIDRSFVRDIIENSDDSAIASTIIAIAHQLRLKVVAEGVERKEQLTLLKVKGCDIAQGYYLSVPKCAEDIEQFILEKTQQS
ncbi:MAG: sensor domain-containing diguanylate cyclase [Methylomonas sp.]|nr:MAG: sensor domain-containing diguanylate cyclase [Methylomonas sp.]